MNRDGTLGNVGGKYSCVQTGQSLTAQVALRQWKGDIRHSLGEPSEREMQSRKKAEVWTKVFHLFFNKLFSETKKPKRGAWLTCCHVESVAVDPASPQHGD